jgi:deoxycytidylate deaminase
MLPTRTELAQRLDDLRLHAARWSSCPAQAVGAEDLWSGIRAVNGAPLPLDSCRLLGCDWVKAGGAGSGRDHARHLHAEAALVASFARRGTSLENRHILVTRAPCPSCALLLVASGINSVVTSFDGVPQGWNPVRDALARAGVRVVIL